MSRPGLRGARRTRVYDCNYNAGQNYYKPTLENLDRKYYGKPLSDRVESPRPTFFSPARETPSSRYNDEPLNDARRRAERVITEDSFFDARGARVPKSSIGAAIEEFDEEFQSTINKIRANKKSATNFSTDVDFDDTVESLKRRNRYELDSGFDDSKASSNSMKKSSFKLTSRREEATVEPTSISKWSAVSSRDEDSGASLRARATKARLDDLESEMFERSEKQLAREKRSQQLKQFLADSEIDVNL